MISCWKSSKVVPGGKFCPGEAFFDDFMLKIIKSGPRGSAQLAVRRKCPIIIKKWSYGALSGGSHCHFFGGQAQCCRPPLEEVLGLVCRGRPSLIHIRIRRADGMSHSPNAVFGADLVWNWAENMSKKEGQRAGVSLKKWSFSLKKSTFFGGPTHAQCSWAGTGKFRLNLVWN